MALPDNFYDNVHAIARKIPKGRVTSYGAIAEALGAKKSSRMVGYAMNLAHQVKEYVPAHRVVNRKGLLTGKHHFGSPTLMQELLEAEGVKIVNDQVIDFRELFWHPFEMEI